MWVFVRSLIIAIAAVIAVLLIFAFSIGFVRAKDDGRYAQSPLKKWFDGLQSAKGFCCSTADAQEVDDYEIRKESYWVKYNGDWHEVPPEALLIQPNYAKRPLLWLTPDKEIRCFLPSSGV